LSNNDFPKCVVVDANFLIALISSGTLEDDMIRIQHFLDSAEKAKARIVIPMPAVAEYLVGADIAGLETFAKLEKKAYILAASFDRAAAFECAQLDRAALGTKDKKDGIDAPWQKIKIDRQIIATGKVHGATLVISADEGVRTNARRVGMDAKTIQELEFPESAKQTKLEFPPQKP